MTIYRSERQCYCGHTEGAHRPDGTCTRCNVGVLHPRDHCGLSINPLNNIEVCPFCHAARKPDLPRQGEPIYRGIASFHYLCNGITTARVTLKPEMAYYKDIPLVESMTCDRVVGDTKTVLADLFTEIPHHKITCPECEGLGGDYFPDWAGCTVCDRDTSTRWNGTGRITDTDTEHWYRCLTGNRDVNTLLSTVRNQS